jgi:hypothetical protein
VRGCAVYNVWDYLCIYGVVVRGMMSYRVERYGVDGSFKVFYIKDLVIRTTR